MSYPFKVNEWEEEDVKVTTVIPEYDDKTKKVKYIKKEISATQRTFRAHSKPRKIVCGKNHVYYCLSKGKYLFRCKNCDWHRILFPITYKFDLKTGIATHRLTGIRV